MSVISVMLAAVQVAIFAACASAAAPPGCDSACQDAYNQGRATDASFWVHPNVTLDPFYATPDNFSDYAVGDLVKWEDIAADAVATNWWVPSGLSLSRFFYVSEDIDESPLPATGYAIIPYQNPLGPDKPFRLAVWAHGTAGFTPQCAPSNNKGLQYNFQAPFALAQQGYVVIAPDYAGQGSTIPQGFMYNAGILHAADVSLAVEAARKNFQSSITHEWVVVGHSEGGLTAWRTAQREADPRKSAGGLIGAVAIAPAMEVMSLVPWVLERANGGPLHEVFLPYMLRSIGRLFPSIDLTKYVTERVLGLVDLSYGGCLNAAVPLLYNLNANDMYLNNANFPSAPEVRDWTAKYHGEGAHALGGPLLVMHGETDFILPHDHIERIFDKQCEAFPDSEAQYLLLPGLDHDGAVQASHSNYFPWIADRFDGKAVNRGCTKTTVTVATDRFATVEQVWTSGGQMLVQ
ncbi:putative secretory lipase [Aspergillus lucknowensis]|uniref:Alpha/Beta hydrolase protein n=1 Tax=Aspergillus lucknowensis TaxID=176173 RepID=A0ABR4LT03_9EURO